jgi:hypothetical protein
VESGGSPQVKGLGLHNQLVGDLKDGGEFVSRNYVFTGPTIVTAVAPKCRSRWSARGGLPEGERSFARIWTLKRHLAVTSTCRSAQPHVESNVCRALWQRD